ncbi:hypothetical protein ACFWDQ_34945 [Streptomyces sp. NPDC060053]|uniref:hypothetical protein n=1 Tax=Streptomyces sp. NPDC060053 TaxID=3347047 RepID=UPI0036C9C851
MSDTGAPSEGIDRAASLLADRLPAPHRALDRRVASTCPHPKPPPEALPMKPDNVSDLVCRLTGLGPLERRRDSADKRGAHLGGQAFMNGLYAASVVARPPAVRRGSRSGRRRRQEVRDRRPTSTAPPAVPRSRGRTFRPRVR